MAKYPAILFYPGDWILGTMGMSFEAKGVYMELLMMQFNSGHMTLDMIGHAVGQKWDTVKHKFVQDENGLFFNVRLDEEKNKRSSYVESRKNNKKGKNQFTKKQKKEGHMTSHMENENINEDKNDISLGKSENLFFDLSELEAKNSIEYIDRTAQKKFTLDEIINLFEAFKVQYSKDFYQNRNKIIQHFRNWLKQQNGKQSNAISQSDQLNSVYASIKQVIAGGN